MKRNKDLIMDMIVYSSPIEKKKLLVDLWNGFDDDNKENALCMLFSIKEVKMRREERERKKNNINFKMKKIHQRPKMIINAIKML